jgi:hypothetical protein
MARSAKPPGLAQPNFGRASRLERQGLITPDLRTAPQVQQARHDGDWSHLVTWLEDQAG